MTSEKLSIYVFAITRFIYRPAASAPGGTVVSNLPANAGDKQNEGLIPGKGRSVGVGNGNPLQYYCLENSMGRVGWWVTVYGITKSQT